ncbi:hypothetical protein AB4354_15540 [Vibrio splendidus]|uniref:hypothetical protein n=1 Tax=Vibrio splendidus TaxID=29497 RepID=UPI000C828B78|nr:hypothetical protein [Vibrio splendidus]PMH06260.1 hypothetical protein BCU75_02050 [Vibrio splendidus]
MKTTLGTFLAIFSLLLSPLLFSTHVHAAAYGVSVAWKTDDAQAVFEVMPRQKKAFANLINAGLVHDMFISESFIGDKKFPMIKFVIEADSEQHVRELIGNLPFQFKELVEVTEIRDIGNKWLNTDVAFTNYAVELAWKEPENQFIVDEVISKDLQMVVDWSAQGVITSAYLKHQEIAQEKPNQKAMIRPVYSMAILAKNEEQAREVASQLNAVKLGFAEVMVSELGFKLEL